MRKMPMNGAGLGCPHMVVGNQWPAAIGDWWHVTSGTTNEVRNYGNYDSFRNCMYSLSIKTLLSSSG